MMMIDSTLNPVTSSTDKFFVKTGLLVCNLVNSNTIPKCWHLSIKLQAPHLRRVISSQYAVNIRLKITGNLPWTNPLLLQSKRMLLPSCTFAICLDTGLGRLQTVLGSLSIRVPIPHQTF
jgi:hypothetical protein